MNFSPLSVVCQLNMGQSPESSTYNKCREGIPFFQGNADFGDRYPQERIWCSKPKKIAYEGDILISVRAPIGALNVADQRCCIGRGLASLHPSEHLDRDYLYYFLFSKEEYLKSKGAGSTFKAISKKQLEDLLIPLPSILEQKKRSNILNRLWSSTIKRRKQLRKLDELVKCRFVEMFGDPVQNNHNWDRYPISKIAPIAGASKPDGDLIWLLNLDMVRAQTGEIISYTYLSPDKIGASTCFFDKQNVLYSKLRPYLNKVVLPDRAGCATSELVPLRPLAMLNRLFLAYLLRSDHFVAFISDKVAGAKMPRVSMDAFKNFECICPPIDIQNTFAAFVQQLDKSRFAIQRSLEETQKLFDSLMQEYFS